MRHSKELPTKLKQYVVKNNVVFKTDTIFLRKIRDIFSLHGINIKCSVLIYDLNIIAPAYLEFVKKFPFSYGVHGGEKLKNYQVFSDHLENIFKILPSGSKSELTFVCIGGGSVGDFTGFLASIYRRGIKLIQIPTTWLAAMDSAFGGKNALNGHAKNQLGTVYPANQVILCEEILSAQPLERSYEAFGEVLKYSFLNPKLARELFSFSDFNSPTAWSILPQCIDIKMKIVQKDLFETKKIRHLLNLGHSIGHAIESAHALPHGIAILYGLEFMLRWAFFRRSVSKKFTDRFRDLLIMKGVRTFLVENKIINYREAIKNLKLLSLLSQDKKLSTKITINEPWITNRSVVMRTLDLSQFEIERKRQVKEDNERILL